MDDRDSCLRRRMLFACEGLGIAHDIGANSGYSSLICEPGCGPAHRIE